jgi:hypothetical protein
MNKILFVAKINEKSLKWRAITEHSNLIRPISLNFPKQYTLRVYNFREVAERFTSRKLFLLSRSWMEDMGILLI